MRQTRTGMDDKYHNSATAKGRIFQTLHRCRSAIALLFYLPAFVFSSPGCTGTEYVAEPYDRKDISLKIKAPERDGAFPGEGPVDIFIFNDDGLKRIDSYQRLMPDGNGTVAAASRKGKKIVVAIANPQQEEYDWGSISSFETISGMYADLRKENPSAPVMSGVMYIEADDNGYFEMELHPVLSEICVRSIRCDFSVRPYNGAVLKNASVYLANINSLAGILEDDCFTPSAPINTDGLPDESRRVLGYPDMVFSEFGEDIGSSPVEPDIRLYCYPNSSAEDTAGTPFTRLVIAGEIEGRKYYYPVNINKGEYAHVTGHSGIGRNYRYILDIIIRQTGSNDPSVPVSPESISIYASVEPWNEMPESVIGY